MGNFYHEYQMDTLSLQNKRLAVFYQHEEEQVRRIHILETELAVERLSSQRSLKLLAEMEKQHYQVKKELAFYEKVMAPEKQADGLVIDNFTIAATQSPRHFRFQVTLVQQLLKKRYAKGYVELAFTGSLADKPHKLALTKISSLSKKELSFNFKYFQIIEGEFTLPEGFTPENIKVSVILPKGKWQKHRRVNESYPWKTTG
ncbi:MAG: hypothetical protein HRT38_00055 [Alteromonadaceae bacterium]|nr:hypothetical protein [Alteromonadaceae bacterium]